MNNQATRENVRAKAAELLGVPVTRLQDSTPIREVVRESILVAELIMELEHAFVLKKAVGTHSGHETFGDLFNEFH